jgi:hypothetical protein
LAMFIKTIISTVLKFYRHGIPSYILSFGDSLGDNLLLTILAKELYENEHKNIWIKCNHQSLFEHNPYIKLVLPYNTLISTTLLNLFNVKVVLLTYTQYQKETDQDLIPDKHIVLKMADHLNLKGNINLKPVFNLSDQEKANGSLAPQQVVIITSNAGANFSMKNKEWFPDRYQQIVSNFGDSYSFIQLGSTADPALENVIDLRGKTTIRESAAILSNAVLMIAHVGFMMHLARAVDCRSVIVYGGREKPEQSGYLCFENIYSDVECSPCWLHNTCYHGKKCMDMISTEKVEQAILHQLQLIDKPLDIDILYND